jgi:hypothetical protein
MNRSPRPAIPPLPWRSLLLATALLFPPLTSAPSAFAATTASKKNDPVAKLSADEIQARLAMFYSTFVNTVSTVAERQSQGDADTDRLRRLTVTKINALRACRATVFQFNPQSAVLDTWALCLQFRLYLESGGGKLECGPDASAWHTAATRLQREIAAVAADILPADQVPLIEARLEAYYHDRPAGSARAIAAPHTKEIQGGIPDLGWLFNLPLAPFRAIADVDTTVQAVSSLSRTVENLTLTTASLPLEISWQSELLLLQTRRDTAALIQTGLEQADRQARALIDHFCLRCLQIIGALLVAGVTLLIISRGLRPRRLPSK